MIKRIFKSPSKPRFVLDDNTAFARDVFMVATSSLKHNIKGVFAREAIPFKSSRILFEYRSEDGLHTIDLAHDNKYIVSIGNLIVDANYNVTSYCNHVQELLNHKLRFNCKYVRSGQKINIVQIASIAQNEELNIQYSHQGDFWDNRILGYPEVILARARKFYNIPDKVISPIRQTQCLEYRSKPQTPEYKTDFNLLELDSLFQWVNGDEECNLKIATLNMNGALFEAKNKEPQFIHQFMTQCGINIIGLTDTRTPVDKSDYITSIIRFPHSKGTAVICFPTKRLEKDSTRLTTMGGQIIIVDNQWEPWITSKRSDPSGLALIVSVSLTHLHQTIVIIQVMVPPPSKGNYTMWDRTTKYLRILELKKVLESMF